MIDDGGAQIFAVDTWMQAFSCVSAPIDVWCTSPRTLTSGPSQYLDLFGRSFFFCYVINVFVWVRRPHSLCSWCVWCCGFRRMCSGMIIGLCFVPFINMFPISLPGSCLRGRSLVCWLFFLCVVLRLCGCCDLLWLIMVVVVFCMRWVLCMFFLIVSLLLFRRRRLIQFTFFWLLFLPLWG